MAGTISRDDTVCIGEFILAVSSNEEEPPQRSFVLSYKGQLDIKWLWVKKMNPWGPQVLVYFAFNQWFFLGTRYF